MKIGVIVPIYNASKTLQRCIESIVNQTYKNLEIILVENGSNDSSLQICQDYALKDERIKVLSLQTNGVSKARNAGLSFLAQVGGRLLYFC